VIPRVEIQELSQAQGAVWANLGRTQAWGTHEIGAKLHLGVDTIKEIEFGALLEVGHETLMIGNDRSEPGAQEAPLLNPGLDGLQLAAQWFEPCDPLGLVFTKLLNQDFDNPPCRHERVVVAGGKY
jgi:hypothetical protein